MVALVANFSKAFLLEPLQIIEDQHSTDVKSKFTYEAEENATVLVNLEEMCVIMDGSSMEMKREDMFISGDMKSLCH